MVQFDEKRLADLSRRHGIVRLRLFGSTVRGEDGPASDVDLIADFGVPVGYFELIRAEDDLSEFFGRPVDLLTEPAISRYMRDAVLASAQVIFGRRILTRSTSATWLRRSSGSPSFSRESSETISTGTGPYRTR